jgi:cardiolipin synthase
VNVANLISLARLIAVPIVIWAMLTGEMALAFWLFVAAGVSDAVDGFIAKHFDSQTALGSYLDPLADKALLVSVYIVAAHVGYLPIWLAILVVFRDILIVGGVVLLYTLGRQPPHMAPLWISKLNTVLQILLAAMVLADGAFDIPPDRVVHALVWLTGATTLLSGVGYLIKWGRSVAGLEDER